MLLESYFLGQHHRFLSHQKHHQHGRRRPDHHPQQIPLGKAAVRSGEDLQRLVTNESQRPVQPAVHVQQVFDLERPFKLYRRPLGVNAFQCVLADPDVEILLEGLEVAAGGIAHRGRGLPLAGVPQFGDHLALGPARPPEQHGDQSQPG